MNMDNKKTILLVEDEAIIALSEKKELEKYGYSIEMATSGETAIEACRGNDDIDLILMDIDLGEGLDGAQTAQKILERRDIPIVFLSSHSEPVVVDKIEKITSYGYILKNANITVLDASIKIAFKLFEANKKFADENEHLSTTLNSISDAIITTDMQGNIISINPVAEKMTGWKIAEIKGKPIEETFVLINSETREPVDSPIKKAIDNELIAGVANHNILVSKDGFEYHISDSGSSIKDTKGNITGVLLVFKDISEEYKIQRTLREKDEKLSAANEMFQTVIDSMPQYICWKDKDSVFLGCNKNHSDMFDLPDTESIIGKTDWDLHRGGKKIIEQYINDDNEVMENNTPRYHIIEEAYYPNGKKRLLDTNKAPLHDAKGNVYGIMIAYSDITEQKKAEEALAQEQYLLQTLMDTTPDHIFFKDKHSRFIKISVSQLEKFGLNDASEILGKTDFDFFTEEHAQQAYDDEQTIIRTGIQIKKEEKETWNDNSITWAYTIKQPLKDKDGTVIGTFGISRDITELKNIEERLAQEQYFLQTLMDTSSDYIYFKDLKSRFLRSSKAHAIYLGLTDPSQMIGKTDFDFFSTNHATEAYKDEQIVIRTGKALKKEEINSRINAPETWVLTEKSPLMDKNGNIIGTFGISRDITERKQAQEALKESNERYQGIIERISDYIFTVYLRNGVIINTVHNPACITVTGYTNEEFSADPYLWFNMVLPEDRDLVEEHTSHILSDTVPDAIEHRIHRKDGALRWIRNTPVLHHDPNGNLISYDGIIVDITERKLAEDKIIKLLQEKELILKEVHHRIKNNMNTINSLLSLQTSTLKEPKAVKALEDAESRVQSMMVLYDKLYQSSSFTDVSVREYIPSLVKQIINNFPNSDSIKIELKLDDVIFSTRVLQPLGIIINELITNIMKYAFIGKNEGLIKVSISLEGEKVKLVIQDNGNGMPESIDFNHSTGFGLMLVETLTKQLDGNIRIDRENGTKIVLELDK
jgi:PAS domain S-box-containing protein